jgi:LPS O-antigen subunit length determinant protein (WzzB/FepE family)
MLTTRADLGSHPDYTEVDKRNKAKAFQTYAYKLNYNQNQRDIFNEGSSSDVKTLIDNKQIDKADLDAAIKMDDELYNSGLTGSLKFSKKFRSTYGYGLPSGGNWYR